MPERIRRDGSLFYNVLMICMYIRRSRESQCTPRDGAVGGGGHRPDRRQMNIIPNPCLELGYSPRNRVGVAGMEPRGFSGHGFQENMNLGIGANLTPAGFLLPSSISEFSSPTGFRLNQGSVGFGDRAEAPAVNPDLYAELPRRRSPKPRKEKRGNRGGARPSHPAHGYRSTFTARPAESSQYPGLGELGSPAESIQSRGSRHSRTSGGSSVPSSKPSINSATYTRQKPVLPNQAQNGFIKNTVLLWINDLQSEPPRLFSPTKKF